MMDPAEVLYDKVSFRVPPSKMDKLDDFICDDFFQGRKSMDYYFWHQKKSSVEKSIRSVSLRANSLKVHDGCDHKKLSSVSTNSTKIFHDFICTLKSVSPVLD